ncbi:hypothetical protein ARMGADRAFT_929956, partial [Armillaria gallica]
KVDSSPPSAKTAKVYATLTRPEASILTQLRTSHIGLNAHLQYICRHDTELRWMWSVFLCISRAKVGLYAMS